MGTLCIIGKGKGTKDGKSIDTAYLLDIDLRTFKVVGAEQLRKYIASGKIKVEDVDESTFDYMLGDSIDVTYSGDGTILYSDSRQVVVVEGAKVRLYTDGEEEYERYMKEMEEAEFDDEEEDLEGEDLEGEEFKIGEDDSEFKFEYDEELEEIKDGLEDSLNVTEETEESIEEEGVKYNKVKKESGYDKIRDKIESSTEKALKLGDVEIDEDDLDDTDGMVESKDGLFGCSECGGTGVKTNSLGLYVECDCVAHKREKERVENKLIEAGKKTHKAVYHISEAEKERMKADKLIPDMRKNDDYDVNIAKRNAGTIGLEQQCKLANYDKYAEVVSKIITMVSSNMKLPYSYLLGAPNGFGKTTLAVTCIMRLKVLGKKVVPYKSLLELAEIKADYEAELSRRIRKRSLVRDVGLSVTDEDDEGFEEIEYTWKDYINADVVFVYLTPATNTYIESSVLKTLLGIRGNYGLPTVVMTETSVKAYQTDYVLKTAIWDEIVTEKEVNARYDRMLHVSTYKKQKQ